MVEPAHHGDGHLENPTVRFEPRDVDVGWVLLVLVVALILGVIVLAGVLQLFYEYRAYHARIKASPFPLAPTPSMDLPPEPRLEMLDLMEGIQRPNVYLRELTKEEVLNSIGPTSEEGFVHIPIDRAMSLLADKLPARAEPPPDQQKRGGGLLDAGEPNSGREFRRRPR
jgi:hypothetical protein